MRGCDLMVSLKFCLIVLKTYRSALKLISLTIVCSKLTISCLPKAPSSFSNSTKFSFSLATPHPLAVLILS